MAIKSNRRRHAFTLVELLVVIGIILLLVAASVTVGGYVTKNAKIRTTKATISMLVAALEAFKEYEDRGSGNFNFPVSPYTEEEDNTGVLPVGGGTDYDDAFLGVGTLNFVGHRDLSSNPKEWDGLNNIENLWAAQASIEVLYFYLDDIPASREVLNKLSGSVTANEDGDFVAMGSGDKGLIEVIDSWKLPLLYQTRGRGNFPLISSAGPDGVFHTADDILSSEL